MTALTLARPGTAHDTREATLDSVMRRVWDGVQSHRHVACPVCGGEMRPRYGAGALPVGARCEDCRTVLT